MWLQSAAREIIANALFVEHAAEGLAMRGWVARPTYSRSQPDMQHFFLNGRAVRDKVIVSAVRQAFRDVLFHGRHPAYVLYLDMDPTLVDVNAHPRSMKSGSETAGRYTISYAIR